MVYANNKAPSRRIVRETIDLYKQNIVSEETLRDIAAFMLFWEISTQLSAKMQIETKKMERKIRGRSSLHKLYGG